MKVCICGGGNLGHVVAGFLAAKSDCEVSVLTRRPECWQQQLSITTPDGDTLHGNIQRITASAEEVVKEADMVLLCLPGFLIKEMLQTIKPFLQPGVAVGSVVSRKSRRYTTKSNDDSSEEHYRRTVRTLEMNAPHGATLLKISGKYTNEYEQEELFTWIWFAVKAVELQWACVQLPQLISTVHEQGQVVIPSCIHPVCTACGKTGRREWFIPRRHCFMKNGRMRLRNCSSQWIRSL